jgi:hypothetical protein
MCCFSPVHAPAGLLRRLLGRAGPRRVAVGETRIFARVEGAVQHLIYSMSVATPADVAMVLPLPVAAGLGEAALCFVDLSGYPDFFADLERAFPLVMAPAAKGGPSRGGPAPEYLVVHQVGSFEASFVPSRGDFDRLDPRFRLPGDVWTARPDYADFGFAVFKLARGRRRTIHPMAMSFQTRDPAAIFVPTFHVHDGRVHDEARFDHTVYYQSAAPSARFVAPADGNLPTLPSHGPLGDHVDAERARDLVDPGRGAVKVLLAGTLPNADCWVRTDRPVAEAA